MKKTKQTAITALMLAASASLSSTAAFATDKVLPMSAVYGPPPASLNIPGDINGDSVIDGQDLTVLLRAKNDGFSDSVQKEKSDLNGDSLLDDTDAKMLINYLNGRTSSLKLKEDLNSDNIVDLQDFQAMKEALSDSDSPVYDADMNNDGVLDDNDLTIVMSYIAKHPESVKMPKYKVEEDYADFDFNGDKNLDLLDLAVFVEKTVQNQNKTEGDIAWAKARIRNLSDMLIDFGYAKELVEFFADSPYDVNNDLTVDMNDYNPLISATWNHHNPYDKNNDVNKDGVVDRDDLNALYNYMHQYKLWDDLHFSPIYGPPPTD